MKTLLGTLLLLAAVVLAAWAVLFRGGPAAPAGPPPPGPRPVPVTLVPVEQGRVAETLELVGDVVSARRSPVAFRRAGQIAEVAVELGDRVEAGRLLARLEDSVLAEQEAAAAAALAAAEADAAFAAREAERAGRVGEDAVSEAERDEKRWRAAAAAALVEQRRAELRRIQAERANGRLTAPFAGVVTARHLSAGAYAAPGSAVVELLDLGRLEVHLEVPALYAARIVEGASVAIRCDALPGRVLERRLARLAPPADPRGRSFTAVVPLGEDTGGLLPGMFVRARLTLAESGEGLVVPADAVRPTEDGFEVVTLGEGAGPGPPPARPVAVEVLARGDGRAAIRPRREGELAVGAPVVLLGLDLVGPGSVLAPAGGSPTGGGPASEAGR